MMEVNQNQVLIPNIRTKDTSWEIYSRKQKLKAHETKEINFIIETMLHFLVFTVGGGNYIAIEKEKNLFNIWYV